jgi:hypothetical protein
VITCFAKRPEDVDWTVFRIDATEFVATLKDAIINKLCLVVSPTKVTLAKEAARGPHLDGTHVIRDVIAEGDKLFVRAPCETDQLSIASGGSSAHVGPMFELEARVFFNEHREALFPWATTVSPLRSRDDVNGGDAVQTRQFDLFGYADGDSLLPCVDDPASGVRVVWPVTHTPQMVDAPPLPKPPVPQSPAVPMGSTSIASSLSTASNASPVDLPGRKYVVGEFYGGWNTLSEEEKCVQLETELVLLLRRHADRTCTPPAASAPAAVGSSMASVARGATDITEIIGAAVLVFSALPRGSAAMRPQQLSDAACLVQTHAGPLIRRLMSAGRMLVAILGPHRAPSACAERESFAILRTAADPRAGAGVTRRGRPEARRGRPEARRGRPEAPSVCAAPIRSCCGCNCGSSG